MFNTFFSRRIHWVFVFLFISFFIFFKLGLLVLLIGFYFFIRFLFRRKKVVLLPNSAPMAPLNGSVFAISLAQRMISMRMNWWKGYGCYLPCSGEIIERTQRGFSLKDERGDIWKLECYPGPWGFLPQVFVLAGDKGLAGGNVGFISGGGSLVLYLPENYEILVKENDILELGRTPLAKRKSAL